MSDLPISYGHDYSQPPIGFFREIDGEMRIEISKGAHITEENIKNLNQVFVPTYEVTKVEDGLVTECRLLGFGLVPGPRKDVK